QMCIRDSLQPDVNLPGTESIIRHIIEGRKFFKKYFNAEPKVAYNFDSFGHSGGLPQILKLAGYEMYVHMRPQKSELSLPSDLYIWRGVDGSEILAYRIAVGLYHTEYDNLEKRMNEGINLALKLNRDVPVFWGIGNHGGGATREDLALIDSFIKKENRVQIIHSTTENFYNAVKNLISSLPIVEGDLQRVFTGCYTSLSRLKRAAQKGLARIVQTESLSSAASWLLNKDFPKSKLESIWRDHLFNDFHDILPGSCIEPAEKDALNLYGKIESELQELNLQSAVDFNHGDKQNFYIPLTVLNSNPALTKAPVEFECMISHRPVLLEDCYLKLFTLDGEEVMCQEEQSEALLPFGNWRRKISFFTDLPSIGVKKFKLELINGRKEKFECKPKIKFEFNEKTGLINKLFTFDDIQVLSGDLFQPLVIEDLGASWGTDCWNYRNVIGEFVHQPGSFRLIERGPIRNVYQNILTYNKSKVVINTFAYKDWDVLEFKLRIYWYEERRRLKLSVPTIFNSDFVLCEVPGGIIRRKCDGEEYVQGKWTLLSAEWGVQSAELGVRNSECGVRNAELKEAAFGIVNNGQHGFDCKNGELRLSVLRSSAYCHEQGFKLDEFPHRKFSDLGVHDVHLLVKAGKFDEVLNSLSALADYLNSPPLAYPHLPISRTSDELKNEQELFTIVPQNIKLLCCKIADDENGLIIRLHETAGKPTHCQLELLKPELKIELDFKPNEIKTIRVLRSGDWHIVNFFET
ncbi:MAG: hypothetical protein N3A61_05000, partial [Ignavibacteria bacterium]|nr:hypothetical protein [Ignavibacteria bacterium]